MLHESANCQSQSKWESQDGIIIQNTMKPASGDNVKVFIRVRPLNDKERNTSQCVEVNGTTIQMRDKEPDHRFSFDHVFNTDATQDQVYQSVGKEVVDEAFQGFNGTVFAYGQTSSGKTHTCIGPHGAGPEEQGILPRMINHLFEKIQAAPSFIEFRIKLSMVEIHMERIKDLLDTSKVDLKIREKSGKGIYIQDVTEEYVASSAETLEFLTKGIGNRSVGQTNMNDTSSRSHMAFIITLYQNNLKNASAKSGKIILIDLAGSEKISKTGAEGKLLDEAKQINKSLSALGNVINALTDPKIPHIPYRDSKLTRLLQESLGGNSKTHLIINVSPSELNESETLSSLRFGFRAKQIKNKPKVNREYTVAELLLLLEKAEKRIQELEVVIKELAANSGKRRSMKKKGHLLVQNLLDSDNPILQSERHSQSEADNLVENQVSKAKLKMHFESECQSDSDQEEARHETRSASKMDRTISEEKELLSEEIQFLNIEKVDLLREMDILQEKYDLISRESRVVGSKLLYLQKENDKLLEKLVQQTCSNQQSALKIQEMQDKIEEYEERILSIAAIQEKEKPKASKIFGPESSVLSAETKKMVAMVMKNKGKQNQQLDDKIQKQIDSIQNKDMRIKELEMKCKVLDEQIGLFKNLEASKESFIKQKLQFVEVKERLYKDLENRIEKVLGLEEMLDEEKQKTKYYQQLIKSSESEKGRKILLLQQHLNETSENYYVLKGQQASWSKNSSRAEKKIEEKNKRILHLEREIIELKEQVENLKLQVEDLEMNPAEERSVLDLDFSIHEEDEDTKRSNIVKVVRSSNFRVLDELQ